MGPCRVLVPELLAVGIEVPACARKGGRLTLPHGMNMEPVKARGEPRDFDLEPDPTQCLPNADTAYSGLNEKVFPSASVTLSNSSSG